MLWRLFKLVARSKGSPSCPRELQDLAQQLDRITNAPQIDALIEAVKVFVNARTLLDRYDEDQYPTLWEVTGREPVPVTWYDNGAEHLSLAVLLWTMDSGGSDFSAAADYELGRAVPSKDWPRECALASRLVRGGLYLRHAYHFAADEELTGFINDVTKLDPSHMTLGTPRECARVRAGALAAGYGLRGWNRLAMKRRERGLDDFREASRFLEELDPTSDQLLWIAAFMALEREDFDGAARKLTELAARPGLDPSIKADLEREAQSLRKERKAPATLRPAQGAMLAMRMIIARAGGLEALLVRGLGEKASRPIVKVVRVYGHMTGLKDESAQALDRAKASAGGFLSGIKAWLGWDASPEPAKP